MKNNEAFFITLVLVVIFVLLQSTLNLVPDIALIIMAFCGAKKGPMNGQILGFCNGLAEDFLTVSFPGFNALIKTLIGFLSGTIKNKIIFDPVIFPSVFICLVTIIKGILAATEAYLFFPQGFFPAVFSYAFLIEIVLNSLLAPIINFALKKTHLIQGDIWGSGK